ncbi:dynein regulatory complex subunit 7 [Xylocopa sonorina]|uniref:dynein regulatory complex subunit 7 n=1 Tax=Xylocopa sonorina TaxID=1818115 RepID=UPI00403AB341
MNEEDDEPKQLRSPTWLQKFRKGNCFECATFLASLLLAQGYNAFVVSGYASREQTLCDLSRETCPYIPKPEKPHRPKSEQPQITKYKLKPVTEYKSIFLSELEDEKAKQLEEKLRTAEKEQQKLIEKLEQLPVDEYWGHRIHAWVAILSELGGLRDHEIPCTLFIEPATGVSYEAADDDTGQLYLGVESIWNDKNYWVNMQSSTRSCVDIVWDLTKVNLWEHLLPGEPWTMRGVGEEIDVEAAVQQEKHLDMPVSYVDEININEEDFERRYPNGSKTMYYKRVKVEFYAPYFHTDGLVQKITIYDDYNYITPVEVYEYYANRSDNLVETRRNMIDDTVVDYYARGRTDQCKEHRYPTTDTRQVDSERILDFYHVARFDGLSRLETHPNYLTQHFVNRDDFLCYRHVQFSRDKKASHLDDIHYRNVTKIIEHFDRDERIIARKNIAIREYAMDENEIRLTYHYERGQFSRAFRKYVKPPLAERGKRLNINPSMTQGYNPLNETDKALDLLYELDAQLKQEDVSISEVRVAEKEVSAFLEVRKAEYFTPRLLISIYDKIGRNTESSTDILAGEWSQSSSQIITDDVDYLKPYLARMGNPLELSTSDANLILNECLNDYKQLHIRRANKILREFEEYSQKLVKTQALLTQNEDLTREEEDQILDKMNEINFYLQTLETRLNRHRELVSKRYQTLVNHLHRSPHLAVLGNDSQ